MLVYKMRFMNAILKNCHFRSVYEKKTFVTSFLLKKIFKIQDEDDFDKRVVNSTIPVVIDFQASWCGPCRILEPRLEATVLKNSDKVHLAKVDIDNNSELAMKYDVQAVPFVLGFKNGKPQKSFTGVLDDDQIESFIKELVK